MGKIYTVEQGDHLSRIAEDNGFLDFATIWEHPRNEALRKQRKLSHVLFPGDQIYIPDKTQREETCATAKVHRFRLKRRPLKLRITLLDFDEQPIPDMTCELEIDKTLFNLKSDRNGIIETPIPRRAREGRLRIRALDLEYEIRVGHLDPVHERAGWRARLINLGYYPGGIDDDGQDEEIRYALEEFQCDHNLPVTGDLDDDTRAALEKTHGV